MRLAPRWYLVIAAVAAFGLGVGVATLLAGGSEHASKPSPARAAGHPGPRLADPAAALARRLPAPEAVGQLFVVGMQGTTPSQGTLQSLRRHGWGGVVLTGDNWAGARSTRRLSARLSAAARSAHRLPLMIGAGPSLPGVTLGRGARAAGVRRHATASGRALRAAGINLTLSPSADVGSQGLPLEQTAVADDPRRVTRVVTAALSGYRRARTIAAVGHFPGQGAAAGDPNVEPASVGQSLAELRARDLRPFAAVVHSAPVVVASNAIYAAFDGATPAVLLPEAMRGLLRERMGYRGVVMSDDLLATSATNHTDVGKTAVDALRAGADLLYVPGAPKDQQQAYAAVLDAWRHGEISTARLQESVARIVALKRAYGLLR
jgi:beta-N-acetylhexosaminidase